MQVLITRSVVDIVEIQVVIALALVSLHDGRLCWREQLAAVVLLTEGLLFVGTVLRALRFLLAHVALRLRPWLAYHRREPRRVVERSLFNLVA